MRILPIAALSTLEKLRGRSEITDTYPANSGSVNFGKVVRS